VAPGAGTGGTPPETAPPPKKEKKESETTAKLVVEVPADARLYIDDHLMKTKSNVRVFNTPTLEPKTSYYYVLRAELVRDGQTVSDTKKIVVRAGQEVRTSFTGLESSLATAQANK
jgi:uncharacterized protein (TIGR03000 family)